MKEEQQCLSVALFFITGELERRVSEVIFAVLKTAVQYENSELTQRTKLVTKLKIQFKEKRCDKNSSIINSKKNHIRVFYVCTYTHTTKAVKLKVISQFY